MNLTELFHAAHSVALKRALVFLQQGPGYITLLHSRMNKAGSEASIVEYWRTGAAMSGTAALRNEFRRMVDEDVEGACSMLKFVQDRHHMSWCRSQLLHILW